MKKANEMSVLERLNAPTPPFFKKLRTAGVIIGTIGAGIAGAGIALPAVVVGLAGYLITGGSILVAVSSVAVDSSENNP